MSRICVDLTANQTFDRHGGIGKYGWYLLEGLVQCDAAISGRVTLSALRHVDGPVLPAAQALAHRGLDEPLLPMDPWKRRRAWRMGQVLRGQVDLFHAVQPAALPLVRGFKVISTIHDIIPLVWPDSTGSALRRAERRGRNLVRWKQRTSGADALIAISARTAADMQQELGVSADKVSVVHHGVDRARFFVEPDPQSVRVRLGLPERYFVSVGSDHPRKNQEALLQAFVSVADQIPDSLVLVGRSLYGTILPGLIQRAAEAGLADRVIWRQDIEDADLPGVYTASRAALAPSLYEGFGMTLLEGMACGAPVAAAMNGAHEEVAADAALWFDGRSVASTADTLLRLSTDDGLVADLKRRGVDRIRELTWRQCAEHTMAAYLKALA
ncbi:MAG: glycosyltransferase involved in cell wall biosynthesis [Myxococcota bacterium]|jgi:glycosyltransferase involved in cell wall biosynthesis